MIKAFYTQVRRDDQESLLSSSVYDAEDNIAADPNFDSMVMSNK